MYFHGGGWVIGGFDTHERLVRELANGAHAAVVFVNYTSSPEAKYLFLWNRHMLPQNGLLKMAKA
jgi:acetyl esterase/lipase